MYSHLSLRIWAWRFCVCRRCSGLHSGSGSVRPATAMLVISGIAVWGVFRGLQVAGLSPADVTLELQAYLGITSVAVLAIAAEVSQRRQNAEELELQAERLRQQAQLLDLAPILVLDMDDRI